MATFTPPSGSLLFRVPEDQTNQATITTSLTSVDSWTVISGDDKFEFIIDGDIITVKYNGDLSPFPYESFGYVDENTKEFFLPPGSTFNDIPSPEKAVNLFLVQQDNSGTKTFIVEVEASGTNIEELPETITGTFDIKIDANYTITKNSLLETLSDRN